jgi:hypothetical protein
MPYLPSPASEQASELRRGVVTSAARAAGRMCAIDLIGEVDEEEVTYDDLT